MKRNKKWIVGLLSMALLATPLAGCGILNRDSDIDPNKTQIYMSAYDGGNGVEWLQTFAKEWSATNDDYQVIVSPEKLSTPEIIATIQSGASSKTTPSIYLAGDPNYQQLIYQGRLENLEGLLEEEIDKDGGKLKDKIGSSADSYSEWKQTMSKGGEGLYMLPFFDNIGVMVFDYEDFVNKGYLTPAKNDSGTKEQLTAQGVTFSVSQTGQLEVTGYTGSDPYFNYKVGDLILTAGKDGRFGTYDDGQPVTESEFALMVNKIVAENPKSRAFMWTSMYSGYLDMLIAAISAQYLGAEEHETYFSLNGPITIDGKVENVTRETGYKVYGNDGFRKAMEFIGTYIHNPKYGFDQSINGSISHTEAQSYFIYNYQMKAEGLEYGNILVDGEWFENEARPAFKEIEEEGRGFGAREYRTLLLPKFEGQKSPDNVSAVGGMSNGGFIVPKQSDAKKLAAIKEFLLYILKDEQLRRYTVTSGTTAAYRYELSPEQYAQLTPFAQNSYQIHQDREHIFVSRYNYRATTNLLAIASDKMCKTAFPVRLDGAAFSSTYSGYKKAATNKPNASVSEIVNDVVNGAKAYYSLSDWNAILEAAKDVGYF